MVREGTVAVRWWRLRPWSANPLMRGSDRLEAFGVMLVVATLLMLIPVSGVVGTSNFVQQSERSHRQQVDGRQVPAVLLDSDVLNRELLVQDSFRSEPVRARWEVGGVEHTGPVEIDARAETGDTVLIWVDQEGRYMRAPRTGTENAIAALGAALAFLVLGSVGGVLTLLGFHGAINRHRISRWQREWQNVRRLPGWPIG